MISSTTPSSQRHPDVSNSMKPTQHRSNCPGGSVCESALSLSMSSLALAPNCLCSPSRSGTTQASLCAVITSWHRLDTSPFAVPITIPRTRKVARVRPRVLLHVLSMSISALFASRLLRRVVRGRLDVPTAFPPVPASKSSRTCDASHRFHSMLASTLLVGPRRSQGRSVVFDRGSYLEGWVGGADEEETCHVAPAWNGRMARQVVSNEGQGTTIQDDMVVHRWTRIQPTEKGGDRNRGKG